MAEYDIPTNQLEDFVNSVHGVALLERGDLGAPACNDCHSNHGAAPPGVTSLSAVCGGCHAIEAQLYEHSPHKPAFEENGFPMCEACHSNHAIVRPSDPMIGLTGDGVCGDCHTSDDGTIASATIDQMRSGLTDLLTAADSARLLYASAREKGMMVTDVEFLIKDVEQAIIKARTHIHAFDTDSVSPLVDTGVTKANAAQQEAASLIDEYYFRRKGLTISTIIMTALAILLFIKIRRVEKR
jgi:predicted CXXCH cytochrome family protein